MLWYYENVNVLRTIVTLLLTLFSIAVIFVVFTVYLVKFNDQSVSGEYVRKIVERSHTLINLLNLNNFGDMRLVYLDKDVDFSVNLVYAEQFIPNSSSAGRVGEMIKVTTGKKVKVDFLQNTTIPVKNMYDDADLNAIRKSISGSFWEQPVLNIVYLSKYAEAPTYLGVTLHRDTVFVFLEAIVDLEENSIITDRLEQSTVMHEWGHLLGIEHLDKDNCIMSARVEIYDYRNLRGYEVPTVYCEETLLQIRKIQQSIN